MKQIVKVVILPATNVIKASVGDHKYIKQLILIGEKKPMLYYQTFFAGMIAQNAQHLYFVSNDEIKEGDWFINTLNVVHQMTKIIKPKGTVVKIIATTDKSLGLSLIPEDFIREYAARSGSIKELSVVMSDNGKQLLGYSIANKETVEEAAKEYQKRETIAFGNDTRVEDMSMTDLRFIIEEAFKVGANWQKQQTNG